MLSISGAQSVLISFSWQALWFEHHNMSIGQNQDEHLASLYIESVFFGTPQQRKGRYPPVDNSSLDHSPIVRDSRPLRFLWFEH